MNKGIALGSFVAGFFCFVFVPVKLFADTVFPFLLLSYMNKGIAFGSFDFVPVKLFADTVFLFC
jgi:hypothetical protein